MYTTTSCYIGHSAIVWDNANFSTVHTWETVGGRLMGYEYTAVVQKQKWFTNYSIIFKMCTIRMWNRLEKALFRHLRGGKVQLILLAASSLSFSHDVISIVCEVFNSKIHAKILYHCSTNCSIIFGFFDIKFPYSLTFYFHLIYRWFGANDLVFWNVCDEYVATNWKAFSVKQLSQSNN